jgi:hypothetical protein
MSWCLASPGVIFRPLHIITYEWAHLASVLRQTRLKSLAQDKHQSLLGSFIRYKENEVF